jgi:2-oxoglutarate ferredoxin oxidoreductase subunit beta
MQKNAVGLTRRDYEGAMSTLCAGCGHDSVTAALVQAFFELDLEPHRVAKLSGIGCSSKTPTYFLNQAHGFNSVHGRMPSIATGANAANGELTYIGISGDGDSLSIGIGQLCHIIRRNVDMLYVLENNGVYGLTKGQFSASADRGTLAKRGEANPFEAIDGALLALTLGATFVARSFSGDKEQLVPILKAGVKHKGFAFVDVISPCVTFNDHEGSTKSYAYTRDHVTDVADIDFVPLRSEIRVGPRAEQMTEVRMHDGSILRFHRVDNSYDPTDRDRAQAYIRDHQKRGEIVTGLLYVSTDSQDLHDTNRTVPKALVDVPYSDLVPGAAALKKLQERFR